ncbi:MAG: response regulator transcription factor [Chloroflexi bacterium]|nr:response regulator transcription factor [Chloroflexota bacterium]
MLLNAEPDIEIVGEASDGDEAIAKTAELAPDVLLLDIAMPGRTGIDVISAIKAENLPVVILMLTMYEDEGHLNAALKAGAMGYVPKKAAETDLISAIRAVQRGEYFVHSSLTKSLVEDVIHGSTTDNNILMDSTKRLSRREQEVLKLVAQGYTNRQVADRLFLSVKTVDSYKARVMEKLNLRGRAELLRYALQHGLLD